MKRTILVSLILILALAGCGNRRQVVPGAVVQAPVTSAARLSVAVPSLRQMRGLSCEECHNALTVDTGGGKAGIAFSHETHFRRGVHCNQCHGTLATHGKMIKPSHPQCFVCHDGKRVSQSCNVCHVSRQRINPHQPGFMKVHGQSALKRQLDCAQCHAKDFCTNCHTLQMPHPRNWSAIHGTQLGSGDCIRCHAKDFCARCHAGTMPQSHHGRDWTQVHGGASLQLGSNCGVCHSSRFCLNCHGLQMPHPNNWTSAHAGPGKTSNGVCWKCHQVNECRTCHTQRKIVGHPMPFVATHPPIARGPNPDCRVCHAPSFCAGCHPQGIDGKIFPGGK